MSYTVYHLHSDYSLLDSCSKFSEYVDLAAEQGMTAIASTEHGLPRSWVEKKLYCDSKGIKFMHGVEIYLTASLQDKVRDNYHTVLIAKNREGFVELNKLIELSTRPDHFYYNNRISFDEFLSISPNIIKISACLASPLFRLDASDPMHMKLARHYDYLEIQHHNVPKQKAYNQYLMNLSKRIGVPLIAGTDTHASSPYKAKCREILMEYKEQHYEGEDGFDLVWKTYDELVEAYETQGVLPRNVYMEAIENTNIMAASVESFTLDKSPKYPVLTGSSESDEKELQRLAWRKLDEKHNSGIIPDSQYDQFKKNIAEELEAFHQTNMSGFMLSMSEIVSWCRNSGKPIGPCRGSVGGSCVAYVTDIIDLNPVTYNTVFSRFCNSSRVELGDIDVDCVDDDRPSIFEHIIQKFGSDKCARVASYGTVADLSFVDDCGGGLAIIWEREHNLFKFNDKGRMNKTKYEFDKKNPYHPSTLKKIKEIYKNDPDKAKAEYPDLFYYFDGFVGTKISQSVHPAGMVISCETLDDNWGIFNKDGERCLLMAMDEAHDVNLVKYDLLILKSVKVIAECCRLAGLHYPRMHEINFNDKAVYDDIAKDATSIFQFESEFAAESLMRFKPKSIDDISVVNAALRPSGASYRDALIARKKNRNPTKLIDSLLTDSLGYLVYQEQIIAMLQHVCGLTASYADTVRRAITKKQKDKVDAAIPKIMDGYCANSDKPRDEALKDAEAFLKVIEDASAYSFGKNHSIGYSLISYLCAYYRHYYPEEYIASYLINAANDDDIKTGKTMAASRGISVTKPKFRQDNRTYYIDREHHTISNALHSIKGIGLKDAEALYQLRDKHYSYFVDLLYDMLYVNNALNTSVIETLIRLDYFSEFGSVSDLLKIYNEFFNGQHKLYKTLSQSSRMNRITLLTQFEINLPKTDNNVLDIIRNETIILGMPVTTCRANNMFAVIDVDTKYSPKVKLYNIERGTTGVMKVLKPTFNRDPLSVGDIISIKSWQRKQAFAFSSGKPVAKHGEFDIWLDKYLICHDKFC